MLAVQQTKLTRSPRTDGLTSRVCCDECCSAVRVRGVGCLWRQASWRPAGPSDYDVCHRFCVRYWCRHPRTAGRLQITSTAFPPCAIRQFLFRRVFFSARQHNYMFSALYAIARPSHGWISEKRLKLDYAIPPYGHGT